MNTLLKCPSRCEGFLAVLPGRWEVVRPLGKGEAQAEGHGVAWCKRCGRKYEIRRLDAPMREAA